MSQYENNYYPNNGAGGGGGYLAGGGSPYGSTSGSPGGSGRKTEASHSLRPVTVGFLKKATQAHTDAEWVVDGSEIGHVTLVAQVITIQSQTTNNVYWLDDGSGRIEARHWIDSTSAEDAEKWGGILENSFVRVTGNLKVFGTKKYINTVNLRPITSTHEIYFHLAECIAVEQIFAKGMPPGPGQDAQQTTNTTNVQASGSAYTSQSRTTTNQFAGLPPLQKAIMDFLGNQPVHDEGVPVGAIARGVNSTDAHQISAALEALMDEGHVYTTIDDSHFQVSL